MKKYISFSGGVESTTMCILYGNNAKGIFADTGAEHDELYERIDYVEKVIKTIHPNFELIKIRNEQHETMIKYMEKMKFFPSVRMRYCTRIFKIEPIEKFIQSEGEIDLLIGLNADETDRTGNLEKLENVNYRYPLIEDDLTREDCIEILNAHNLNPEFPPYMLRGGCFMCFFKRESEYKAMYFLDRKTFDRVKDLENKIQDRRESFFSILPTKTMQQIENECIQEQAFLQTDMKEIYKRVEKTTYCGGFCHR